ncbi:hypothetical protein [Methanobacterium spitsbergense]|uniref:Uncharacterized protein n=1 Tax=Methanobacterium spitsbergense TaxID=2874285 RepID=A0A8T5UYQ1_9EURY|nr:hypothetical protein [Methanobacterium spitsbergense]MBZ2166300.1 hypothetical protein [Methanobacterium spitsbergense]
MDLVLYGFDKVETAIQNKLKTLINPGAITYQVDENGTPIFDDQGNRLPLLDDNGDPIPDTSPIALNVLLHKPENLEMFDGTVIILKIIQVPETGPKGMGKQMDKAVLNGTAYLFVNGDDDDATLLCKRYTDIIGALFKIKTLLSDEFPGTQVLKPGGPVHDFRIVNVDPKNPKMPHKTTASATSFRIFKPPEKPVTIP